MPIFSKRMRLNNVSLEHPKPTPAIRSAGNRSQSSRTRETWIDVIKVIACILVFVGHFFQSMVRSGLMEPTVVYEWFQSTIYSFHVPLFFICSGYVYQKYSVVDSFPSWLRSITKKAISFGVPYFVFSLATLFLKQIAGDYANVSNGGVLHSLLIEPMPPYWYLYTSLFVFAITPTIKSKKQVALITLLTLLIKFSIQFNDGDDFPFIISSLFEYEFWFLVGIDLAVLGVSRKAARILLPVGALFFPLSIAASFLGLSGDSLIMFIVGLLACVFVCSGAYLAHCSNNGPTTLMGAAIRYTFPVFLMHTIFAAGVRALLLKIGILNLGVHILFGLTASVVGPILAMIVMTKLKPLDGIVYPYQYVAAYLRIGEDDGIKQ